MTNISQLFIRRALIFTAVCLVLLSVAGSVLAADLASDCVPNGTIKGADGKTVTGKQEPNALIQAVYGSSIKGGLLSGVTDGCIQCGACKLCDFLNVANQLARMIFGVFGAVALAMFIYGGVQFIISSGNTELVGKAKTTLVNAVIGIFIIAFAWQIVHVVLMVLGTPEEQGKPGTILIFGKPWDDPCGSSALKADQIVSPEQNQNPPATEPVQ